MADPNFQNRTLFHGNNLDFLQGMDSETVDLVATDPPFKKGRDFHATPDSLAAGARFEDRWFWDRDVHPDWVDTIKDDWHAAWTVIEAARAASGDDMGAYLCWLGVRLMECHRILKPTGSLYLHIDHTAHAYVKALLDGIFGKRNFRNEIVWRRTGTHNKAQRFAPIHDIILFYTKTDGFNWKNMRRPYMKGHVEEYFVQDTQGWRTSYYGNVLTGSGIRGGESGKPWRGIDPSAKGRHWAIPRRLLEEIDEDLAHLSQHQKLDRLYELGYVKIQEGHAWPTYEHYVKPEDGQILPDIWAYQPYTDGTVFGRDDSVDSDVRWLSTTDLERTGYPTQKPLALYERMIKASSNPGDWVLDPFAGCATTCVAAEKLERNWVGIDIWDGAIGQVRKRLEENKQLLADPDPQVLYLTKSPERTDDNEVAAPFLRLKLQRPLERWQRLNHKEIVEHLVAAQASMNMVICGGCGRVLEREFLHLDHINPRAQGGANDITNRILLCYPCNSRKGAKLTLIGLMSENKKEKWMQDEGRAKLAQGSARAKAEQVRTDPSLAGYD